jgi:Ca-activated chloride channel homolog
MARGRKQAGVRLELRASRKAIGEVGDGLHVLVRAEPPAPPMSGVRRPVALALVIDRSGSMGEPARRPETVAEPTFTSRSRSSIPGRTGGDSGAPDKLSFVKAATLRLLDLMHDGDAVALVSFDDTVTVLKPLTVLDDRSRRAIAGAVKRIETGGSTFLEGGLKSGLEQFNAQARGRYGCKLVLLSDGEANVGEQRPAVLAEVAAGGAHNGVTTSTLGVGFDYNIALMSAVAEAGNGDFTHIHALEALDEILREEFTTAADVTARGVEVNVDLPERVAFGTNLNSYRQEATDSGFKVLLGDLVRPKEFIFEITTPVPFEGDQLLLLARARYRDLEDRRQESLASAAIRICPLEEAQREPVDDDVISKLLIQAPAQAEMTSMLAYEAGDFQGVNAALQASRSALDDVRQRYGMAVAQRVELSAWEARLGRLTASSETRSLSAADMKMTFAAGYDRSRSRSRGPSPTM